MTFEMLVRIIAQRVSFGQTLPEVHDSIVDSEVTEEMFFFAWHAAKLV